MELARSMFLDEKLTPDDDRLNYQSYKELGLICDQCRQLVFFKPCIERVSHFSHFKDTGKGCEWKTKNNTNTSKQDTDSESREQSLQEFRLNFKKLFITGQLIIKISQIFNLKIANFKVKP